MKHTYRRAQYDSRIWNDLSNFLFNEIYEAYQRCLRLMSYLQAVESMGLISAAEYRDFEIQILSLTQRLQSAYKSLNPTKTPQC